MNPLPWNNISQIHVEFSEDVRSVDQAEFGLFGSTGGHLSSNIAYVTYDASSQRATIQLNNPLVTDYYTLVVHDTISAGPSQPQLDGEWTDETSTGNSGNGTAGGEFRFGFRVLPGDVNQSGSVAVDDVHGIRTGLGHSAGQTNYSMFADLNGSGMIAVSDLGPLRTNLGSSVPDTPPTVPSFVAAVPVPVTVQWGSDDIDAIMAASLGRGDESSDSGDERIDHEFGALIEDIARQPSRARGGLMTAPDEA